MALNQDASAKDPDKNVPWKNAWLGKTKQIVDMLKKMCPPGTQITALAIAGGPACNWERQQLFDVYTKLYPNLRLKQLGDVADLHIWLKGRANRAPHQLSEQLGRRATRSECGGKVYGLPYRVRPRRWRPLLGGHLVRGQGQLQVARGRDR